MPDTWVALGVMMARRTSVDAGQKSRCRKFHQICTGKRRRVYEYYWAHFAAEIHWSE
jgi:hypothetical protein